MARTNGKVSGCFKAAMNMSARDVARIEKLADKYSTGDITADYKSAIQDAMTEDRKLLNALQAAMPPSALKPIAAAVTADRIITSPTLTSNTVANVTAKLLGFFKTKAISSKVRVMQTLEEALAHAGISLDLMQPSTKYKRLDLTGAYRQWFEWNENNITPEEFANLLAAYKNKAPITGTRTKTSVAFDKKKGPLQFDHLVVTNNNGTTRQITPEVLTNAGIAEKHFEVFYEGLETISKTAPADRGELSAEYRKAANNAWGSDEQMFDLLSDLSLTLKSVSPETETFAPNDTRELINRMAERDARATRAEIISKYFDRHNLELEGRAKEFLDRQVAIWEAGGMIGPYMPEVVKRSYRDYDGALTDVRTTLAAERQDVFEDTEKFLYNKPSIIRHMVYSSILKQMDKQFDYLPTMGKDLIDATIASMEANPTSGNFSQAYERTTKATDPAPTHAINYLGLDGVPMTGKWRFYSKGMEEYVGARSISTWCTSRGMQRTYLPQGNFLTFSNGKDQTQVAIRYVKNKVVEIQNKANDRTISEADMLAVEALLDAKILESEKQDGLEEYLAKNKVTTSGTSELAAARRRERLIQHAKTTDEYAELLTLLGVNAKVEGGELVIDGDLSSASLDLTLGDNIKLRLSQNIVRVNGDIIIDSNNNKYPNIKTVGGKILTEDRVDLTAAEITYLRKGPVEAREFYLESLNREQRNLDELTKNGPIKYHILKGTELPDDIDTSGHYRDPAAYYIVRPSYLDPARLKVVDVYGREERVKRKVLDLSKAAEHNHTHAVDESKNSIEEALFNLTEVDELSDKNNGQPIKGFPVSDLDILRALPKIVLSPEQRLAQDAFNQNKITPDGFVPDSDFLKLGDFQFSKDGSVQGFHNPKTGQSYLIADGIAKGDELAVALHEIGVHQGLEKMLGKARYDKLVNQIKEWATKPDTQEGQLANAALARAKKADTKASQMDHEMLAYFIEGAVNAGVDPAATSSSPLVAWLKELWTHIKLALQGMKYNPTSLTAKDLVNLAYGSAKLQLNGQDNSSVMPLEYKAPTPEPFTGTVPKQDSPGHGLRTVASLYNMLNAQPVAPSIPTAETMNEPVMSKETIDANPGGNILRIARLLGPQLYGSPEHLATVTVKEMFQNSFDAIKGAIQRGDITGGKIDIKMNSNDRTITIHDNGSGMPSKILANEFLQIAGTHKDSDRPSGSFGIAKMLFLYGNKTLDVITANNGKVSVMRTSGDELMAALENKSAPMPKIEIVPFGGIYKNMFPDGHGTFIKVVVPENYVDPADGKTKDIRFNSYGYREHVSLVKSPLLTNVAVTFDGGHNGVEIVPVGAAFPHDDFTQLANVKFAWGTAHIYVTKEATGRVSKYDNNVHYLSNGLWQFSGQVAIGQGWEATAVPRTFYIDLSPTVKADEAGYPFELSRQGFSKTAAEDMNKVSGYLSRLFEADQMMGQVLHFGIAQYYDMDDDGNVTVTAPHELRPPIKSNTPVDQLNKDDKIEVKDGKLIVNGRVVPELSPEEMRNARIDVKTMKIDQSEIDPNKVMLHDNLLVPKEMMGIVDRDKEIMRLQRKADRLRNKRDMLSLADDEWNKLDDEINGIGDEIRKINSGASSGKTELVPLTELAREKFGPQFDNFTHTTGEIFSQIRQLVVQAMGHRYAGLLDTGIGISFDVEYRGVSITAPFSAAFVNPALTEFDDPVEAGIGIYGTMIHELAHFKVRSHDADFPAEMQRIMIKLYNLDDGATVREAQQHLIKLYKDNEDVFKFIRERASHADSKARGERFKDPDNSESVERAAENVADIGSGTESYSGISRQDATGSQDSGRVKNDIVRAEGNRSAESLSPSEQVESDAAQIQFSKSSDHIRSMMSNKSKDNWTTVKDYFNKLGPAFLSNAQLVEQYGSKVLKKGKLVTLGLYQAIQARMTQERTIQALEFHKIAVAWDKLPKAIKAQLNKVMLTATLKEIHPDQPFTPGVNGTPNGHLKESDRGAYNQLVSQYQALGSEGKGMYQTAKDALADQWQKRKEAYQNLVKYTFAARVADAVKRGDAAAVARLDKAQQDSVASYEKELATIKGPYFPLMRFGDYLVIGESQTLLDAKAQLKDAVGPARAALEKKILALKKDSAHYQVTAHESAGKAKAAERAMAATGLATRTDMTDQNIDRMSTVSQDTLSNIGHIIDAQFDKNIAGKLNDAIADIYLRSLPEIHALRREAHRKGIEGASPDMLRAFASAGQSGAFYISRLKHSSEMMDTLFRMKAEAKGDTAMQHIHREMEKRLALDMQFNDTPVQDFMSTASWVYHLGMSPSNWVINMTQPWLITAPLLAGRHGIAAATRALGGAHADAVAVLKAARFKNGKIDWWSGIDEDSIPGTNDGHLERKALRELMQSGIVDEGLQHELNIFAGDKSRWIADFNRKLSWGNQQVELVNRTSSALAAFRLEFAKATGTPEAKYKQAYQYAYDVTLNSQFDYSQEGTARIMRTGGGVPLAKLVFQFRKFQQGMLYTLGSNIKKAFGEGQDAKDARAALFYLTFTSGMSAGVMGMPFATLLFMLAGAFRDPDDPEGDAKTAFRNALLRITGDKTMADVLAKGIPTAFGMDVSSRLGMGDVASAFPMAQFDAKRGIDQEGKLLVAALGAPASMAGNMYDGWVAMLNGDFQKGTEKLMPKAAADLAKAYRYGTKGMTDASGDPTGTDIGPGAVAARAFGFQPTRETDYFEGTKAIKNTETAIKDRETRIASVYKDGLRSGDMADARTEIAKFNRDHPENPITPKTELGWRKAGTATVQNRQPGSGVKLGTKTQAQYNKLADFAR